MERVPQFFQGSIDRMLDHIQNGIRSVRRKAAPSLIARQSGRGIGGCRTHRLLPSLGILGRFSQVMVSLLIGVLVLKLAWGCLQL